MCPNWVLQARFPGSGLWDGDVCVGHLLGNAPRSTPVEGKEGSRIGKRGNWDCKAVSSKTSVDPTGSPGAGMTFRVVASWGDRDEPLFSTPISPWMWLSQRALSSGAQISREADSWQCSQQTWRGVRAAYHSIRCPKGEECLNKDIITRYRL